MNLQLKRRLQISIGVICSLAIVFTSIPVMAAKSDTLENQSSALQEELAGINSEIKSMSTEIAKVESKIEDTSNAIISKEEQLSIIRSNETKQYSDMKSRIKYMYENGSTTLLEMLFSADDMADFVNKADFIESISSYDREMLDELRATLTTIQNEQAKLKKQKDSLESLESDLQEKQSALNAKAAETSTSISAVNAQIAEAKAAEAKAKEEAAKKAAEKAAASNASKKASSGSGSSGSSSSGKDYTYSSGGGLTPSKGVVYFNGHRETYYSQRVLPGKGLKIPGRHVASDGTIRDKDNYICVASSDHKKGTLVLTSLGMGKVYDSGCASGTIDLYTDW